MGKKNGRKSLNMLEDIGVENNANVINVESGRRGKRIEAFEAQSKLVMPEKERVKRTKKKIKETEGDTKTSNDLIHIEPETKKKDKRKKKIQEELELEEINGKNIELDSSAVEPSGVKKKKKKNKKNIDTLEHHSFIMKDDPEENKYAMERLPEGKQDQEKVKKKKKKELENEKADDKFDVEPEPEKKKRKLEKSCQDIKFEEMSEENMNLHTVKKKKKGKKVTTVKGNSIDEDNEQVDVEIENLNKEKSEAVSLKSVHLVLSQEKSTMKKKNENDQDKNQEKAVPLKQQLKRKKKSDDESSSGDEIVAMKKRKMKALESSDEESEELGGENDSGPKLDQMKLKPTPGRIKRCLDSSDEEDDESVATPKVERLNKLKMLANMLSQKKGKKLVYLDDEVEDQHSSDCTDEDDLPMFENEEFPPDEATPIKREDEEQCSEEDDADSFLDDDEEDLEEESSSSEEDEEEDINEDENNQVYLNPYLDRGSLGEENIMEIFNRSIKSLAKDTDEDKQNKRRYREEMGRYQLAVHSSKNKAALTDNKVRYKRNMKMARFDKGLKEMRNLDVKDDEFHNTQEVALYGERVQIFPHSKMRSKRPGRCELTGCSREFQPTDSKIVGAKMFDPFSLEFAKKKKRFDKEAFYWICRHHMLEDADTDSDEFSDEN